MHEEHKAGGTVGRAVTLARVRNAEQVRRKRAISRLSSRLARIHRIFVGSSRKKPGNWFPVRPSFSRERETKPLRGQRTAISPGFFGYIVQVRRRAGVPKFMGRSSLTFGEAESKRNEAREEDRVRCNANKLAEGINTARGVLKLHSILPSKMPRIM